MLKFAGNWSARLSGFYRMRLTVFKVFNTKQKSHIIQYQSYKKFSNDTFVNDTHKLCFFQLKFIWENHSFLKLKKVRNNHWRCSVRRGVLRNFVKFTGKYLCQSLFFQSVNVTLKNHAIFWEYKFLSEPGSLHLKNYKWLCFRGKFLNTNSETHRKIFKNVTIVPRL